jgi:ring-1,2-phenylacetyl-CoA epoxidase subunit PaaD
VNGATGSARAVDPLDHARAVASGVTDPEMPMLTLADLGVLREVTLDAEGRVVVTITPTYSGCPAMTAMRDDLVHRLADAGFGAEVRVSLSPPWSSDWITQQGRTVLAQHGISPPLAAPRRSGPVPLTLSPPARALRCPRCGRDEVELTSEFGPTACTALYRCRSCGEPFEHVKEI